MLLSVTSNRVLIRLNIRSPEKSAELFFLISRPKHMLGYSKEPSQ